MSKMVNINVRHITRVEGHGNIVLRARDGVIEKLEWQVPEAPRFFCAMIRGRKWDEIQPIVSRICGICSVSHSLAATKAVEDALGIDVSEQTSKLRLLLHYSEQLQSHILHAGYLVAPDLLGAKSVVPLVASHPDAVKTIIAIHRAANTWTEMLAGRITHPVTVVPGGFSMLPSEGTVRSLLKMLEETVPLLKTVAGIILSARDKLPDFSRETEYISLINPGVYAFYDGSIGSTDTVEAVDIHRFESVVNEYVSPQSTAKWTKWHRDSYAVGALARFKLNFEYLMPMAAKTAESFGLTRDCCNPYLNTIAQVVECVHVVEHSMQLIGELLSSGIRPENRKVAAKSGLGVGCVEAPRGILFHKYAFDENGRCESGNICIPTNQNHANIQRDFEALVPTIINRSQDEIRMLLEMLVRSYDPCISCSTHCLDVEFV